jgi:hypothetical protein
VVPSLWFWKQHHHQPHYFFHFESRSSKLV